MTRRGEAMRDAIQCAAKDIVREEGPDKLTFDAVAARVGVSKQAVLYWFPNKARLVEALVRPALEAEAKALATGSPENCMKPTLEQNMNCGQMAIGCQVERQLAAQTARIGVSSVAYFNAFSTRFMQMPSSSALTPSRNQSDG